jgi:hypothetical protein
VKSVFLSLNVKYAGELVFSGVDEKGAILKVPDALEKAFQAGVDLVSK